MPEGAMDMSTEFSLAHLSDPHLPPPPGAARVWGQRPKQLLALLSWHRKRHRLHNLAIMAALRGQIGAQAPDHIAVTGDLINLAAPAEFPAGAAWLASLGPADTVSYVPGNHDLTVPVAWADGPGLWSDWMAGGAFPYLKRRGPLALIGLNCAIATPIGSAAGALGAAQLQRLGALLDEAARINLIRVVLIHHPPVMGPGGRRKALRDRAALCAVLRTHGADLVLHGHHHRTRLSALPGPAGPITVFGAPAALAHGLPPGQAGWHLHRFSRAAAGWRLTTMPRRFDPAAGRFMPAGEWTIDLS
jgi:3',5'-cyclic AMP phosphodiesterase CpdA